MILKKNELVFLLASSTVVVFAWIGFSIYHSSVTSTVSPTASLQIQPITPNFDTQTIASLKARKKVAPLLDSQSPLPTPNESSTAARQPTNSAPTPTAVPNTSGT